MYGRINRGYGVLLSDASGPKIDTDKYLDFLRDLVRLDEEFIKEEWGSSVSDISLWSEDECLEFLEESPYVWTAYSGGGDPPYAVGVSVHSWAYWKLEGPGNILEFARKIDPTQKELDSWNSEVSDDVKKLLGKHGLEPGVFWTTSTS